MLKDINVDAFVRADLNLEQALAYLRNEALVLDGVAQGIVLVTYEGVPLGFVKNVGNRCNNLYPKEWRIRKL
jgi:NOL1/NOP2/fmu family ribosome biogenesis protein